MKLYAFNPDTDMALADNSENYISPASVRRMAQDLALLPVWYAQPGSAVLAPSAYNADYLQAMKELFSLPVQLITEPELSDYAESHIMPWGWNPAFRKRMLKGGIIERKLPTLDDLEIYREMFSRIHTMALYLIFEINDVDYTCGRHYLIEGSGKRECSDAIAKQFDGGCVFKSLWSGSGKGLRWCRRGFPKATADWCKHELEKYGAVVVEPIYNKVGDFAMEFHSDGQGKLLFTGYSRFTTDEKGVYRGNILISDVEVEEWLQQYVPLQAVIEIRECLQKSLKTLYAESYTGPLGVDMMVCTQKEGHPYAIHPHVEINLRMTMGIVAHQLYRNFVAPGSKGHFFIDYFPCNEALRVQHEQDMQNYPLVVEEGRLVSGYLSLTPVTPQSRYRAYMLGRADIADTHEYALS